MINRIPFFACAFATVLLASCAPQHPKDIHMIDSLRVQAESYVKAHQRFLYGQWTTGAEYDDDSLSREYVSLFTADNVALVQRAYSDEEDSLQRRRLSYFCRFLVDGFMDRTLAPLRDSAQRIAVTSTVQIGSTHIPYSQLTSFLNTERNPTLRSSAYAAADPILDRLNDVSRAIRDTTVDLSHELGFPSEQSMTEFLLGFSLRRWSDTASAILEKTDTLYRVLLQERLVSLHIQPDALFRYDLDRLIDSRDFDRYFPAATIEQALTAAFRGLSLDSTTLKNITIGVSDRPGKRPPPRFFAVDVPSDVRLCLTPSGGVAEYMETFRQLGHVLHYAATREFSFEFRFAGDHTAQTAFSALWEQLPVNQAWLRLRTSMPTPVLKEFLRRQTFRRVFLLRQACAQVVYEYHLLTGAENPEALFESLMSRTLGYTVHPSDRKRYLSDSRTVYRGSTYLRARLLSAQLNEKLTRGFGPNWFEYAGAGALLQSLWATGDKLEGEEIAGLLGNEGIATEAWISEINRALLLSTR